MHKTPSIVEARRIDDPEKFSQLSYVAIGPDLRILDDNLGSAGKLSFPSHPAASYDFEGPLGNS